MRRVSAASLSGSPYRPSLGIPSFNPTGASGRRRSSTTRLDPYWQANLNKKSNNMWSNKIGESMGLIPGRSYFGPLFLCLLSPLFVMIMQHVLIHCDGSILVYWNELKSGGFIKCLYNTWPTFRNLTIWKMILIFMSVQLLIMKLIPGKSYRGPISPAGNIPRYTANGFQSYIITLILYNLGIYFGIYKGGIVYDNMGQILSSMNILALLFCLGLYLKGLYFPSSSDHGSTGNPIFDFYWGTELYPRIFGWDIKQFTNCRCGMMFWSIFIISCGYKQQEIYGHLSNGIIVNIGLQLIYISKFFIWETGYLSSMDIAHDRAGFYICWGVLVFLPAVYTSHSTFLVKNPHSITFLSAILFFSMGVFCIWINFDCDRQRQFFRRNHGMCKIWGQDPFFIQAKYKTETGETKTNLLLGSGWWGVARHFHYLPEIMAASCWTLPINTQAWLPYFYVPYLILLLVDRAYRDDARCRSKYGKYWEQYCKRVPYMILPGVL